MRYYDYSNPPNVTEGPEALWTPEEREAFMAEWMESKGRYIFGTEHDKAFKARSAAREVEREMWEFAYGIGMESEYIQWLRQISFDTNGGCWELPKYSGGRTESWRTVLDEIVSAFVADLHDDDAWDMDHCEDAEVRCTLWITKLSVYRIWKIMKAVEDAAEEAMRENLMAMACDDRGAGNAVKVVTRRKMEGMCEALWKEFEASEKVA